MNVVGSFSVRRPHKFLAPSTPETNTTITIDEATLNMLNGGVKSECKCRCETVVGEKGEKGETGEKGLQGEIGPRGEMPKCVIKKFTFSSDNLTSRYQLTGIEQMLKNSDVIRVETSVIFSVKKNRSVEIKVYIEEDRQLFYANEIGYPQDCLGSLKFGFNMMKSLGNKSNVYWIEAIVKDKTKKEFYKIEVDMFMYGMNIEREYCQIDDGPHREIEFVLDHLKKSAQIESEAEVVEEIEVENNNIKNNTDADTNTEAEVVVEDEVTKKA